MEVKELDTPDLSDPLAQRKVPKKEPSSKPALTTDQGIDTPRGRFYLEKEYGLISLRMQGEDRDWFVLKIGHGKDGKLAFALYNSLPEESFELAKGTKIREYKGIDDLCPIEEEEEADPHGDDEDGYCSDSRCAICLDAKFGSDNPDAHSKCSVCGTSWVCHNGHLCP